MFGVEDDHGLLLFKIFSFYALLFINFFLLYFISTSFQFLKHADRSCIRWKCLEHVRCLHSTCRRFILSLIWTFERRFERMRFNLLNVFLLVKNDLIVYALAFYVISIVFCVVCTTSSSRCVRCLFSFERLNSFIILCLDPYFDCFKNVLICFVNFRLFLRHIQKRLKHYSVRVHVCRSSIWYKKTSDVAVQWKEAKLGRRNVCLYIPT